MVTRAEKVYEPCESLAAVRDRASLLVAIHNESFPNNSLHLILFSEAVLHLIRIARVLCQPRGSALLVGIHGSGACLCVPVSVCVSV